MKRQAGWIAAEAAVGMVGTVLTTFLVSRIIGPAEVGLAALAGAVVMLAQAFAGYCFTNAMVQRSQLTPTDIASVLWTSIAIAVALAVPIAAVGLTEPTWLAPGVGPVLAALTLVLPFNAIEGTANGVLLRQGTFRGLALRSIGAHVVGLVTGLSLALSGWGVWAVVIQQIAFFATAAILAAAFARLLPSLVLRVAPLREMARFVITSAISGIAGRIGFRMFLLVVAGGLPALAGVLQIAFRIVEVARELPSPFVHRYGLPALSRLRTDPPAFLKRLEAVCRLSGLIFAPVFSGLALCAPEVQMVLLGPAWADIVAPIQVLSTALTFTAFGLPLGLALIAAGWPMFNLALTLGGISMALLLAFLVPKGNGMAAAAAWSVTLIIDVVAAGIFAAWRLNFRLSRQLRLLGTTLLPAAATTVALLSVDAAGLLAASSPLVTLVVKVVVGGIAGGVPVILLARRPWHEISLPVPTPD